MMNEEQLILLAETGDDDSANEAMSILRKEYDPTYMWCSECDYLVVKESECCMNKKEEKDLDNQPF
jgi:hypothetical protein